MPRFPAPIDHVYILCDPQKEPDRAAYLQAWLSKHDIDPANYTMVLDTYGDDPFFQTKAVWDFYDPWSTKHGRQPLNFNRANLKPAELSLIWNWAGVARRAVQAQHRVVMILESDVLFCPDFQTVRIDESERVRQSGRKFGGSDQGSDLSESSTDFLQRFQASLTALEAETGGAWDFLSLSASVNLVPAHSIPGRLWYPPNHPQLPTRCADSMVFRVPLLAKILETLWPVAEVLDWELNFQLVLHNARALWLHPPVMRQGSGVTAEHTYPTRI